MTIGCSKSFLRTKLELFRTSRHLYFLQILENTCTCMGAHRNFPRGDSESKNGPHKEKDMPLT